MTDARRETKSTILERGHKALMDALGPAGAVEFMRLAGDADRPEDTRAGVKDTLVNISIDEQSQEVVLRFSRQTTWLRFSGADGLHFAREVARRAIALIQDQA